MEGMINVLKDQHNVITKGLVNFKKCGKDKLTLEYIETRQELLEKDWSLFKDTNTKLYQNLKSEDIVQNFVDIYDKTEDTYITYKSLMKSTLNKLQIVQNATKSADAGTSKRSNSFVKLPKITIPTFSGKYSEWTTFYDLFTSLVHKNSSLDNVQKLHYLKSHLSGEAEQLIRHTPITDANYVQCWAQLQQRYCNKKYLTNCILRRLFAQKRMHVGSASVLKDLIDTTCDCLNALKNLNIDVSTWDVIIIHIVTFKLDNETRTQWELSLGSNDSNSDLPTFDQFKIFIENRFRALECLEPTKVIAHQANKHNYSSPGHSAKAMLAVRSTNMRCEYCLEGHKLCFCKTFTKQPVEQRRTFVLKNNICFNCMGSNHTVRDCKKPTTCRLCHKRHHSLLHLYPAQNIEGQSTSTKPAIDSTSSELKSDQVVSCLATGIITREPRQVLLATALIRAESKTGQYQIVRALVDQGSQGCFITEATVQFLRLKKIPVKGLISGLGDNRSTIIKYMVHLNIQSRLEPNFNLQISAYVLTKITSYLPECHIKTSLDWIGAADLQLADPSFGTPNKIDVLLGAEVYCSILKEGVLKNSAGTLVAQSTSFGWILSGAVSTYDSKKLKTISVMHAQISEDEMLKKFWEIEEQKNTRKVFSPEERKCEEFYTASTKRDQKGRYIVSLPFKDKIPSCQFASSRAIAEKRFRTLEKRLQNNTDLRKEYTQVLKEYLHLGHMQPVSKDDVNRQNGIYSPHHAVIRDDKTTTKVRVVFNASEKNANGISLNDMLMVGPTLQSDLRHTVLRWRAHYIALVADIIKMYRQVKIADQDAKFQRILWRDDPGEDIKDYELVTVTFGTASAPYQAVRTLHQVAYDEGESLPLAKDKVLNCFYMDDLMTGCNTIETGLEIYKQMTALLGKGGFKLQKWNSNNKDLTEEINRLERINNEEPTNQTRKNKINEDNTNKIRTIQDIENRSEYKEERKSENKEETEVEIKLDTTIKILGLTWNRSEDTFQYSVNLSPLTTAVTKRSILSDIARLFDPLGWLAPSVVLGKIFMQRLWLVGVGWDEVPPAELIREWMTYRNELPLLSQVKIPRWLGTSSTDEVELHGFSDASKAAYAAVTYLRNVDAEGKVQVFLVAAKTRVAPIKQISIPRLELCGAVLLSQLLMETSEVLDIAKDKIRAWTDSTVVLAWLNSHPSKWKTFVANRTSEILTSMNSSQWCHVSSKENPADFASRGILPSSLLSNDLWFSGPSFLKNKTIIYNKPKLHNVDLEASVKVHLTLIPDTSFFERFSKFPKLVRVVAYCRRLLKANKIYHSKYLHKVEIDAALKCCIKVVQREIFTIEYEQLQDKGYLQFKSSTLKSLCPYLDDNGILRVTGRLEKSQLSEQAKHLIILPRSSHFTKLIVANAHDKTLHGGPQLMMQYLRSSYWIIGIRTLVKQHVSKCVICARQKATFKNQFMGSLPAVRCTPARPFIHSGVDYAGPINIRTTKGRGHRSYKGYICLFVCMATRAVHLEVVSDMTAPAFLAAFRRFVARRGHCSKLYSDNGTTFVGSSRELQHLTSIQQDISQHLEINNTEWHFIPPHSPNFGGLWEAGIKSTKTHLKRTIGDATLTYEELSTLLSQVEACLNSRPISVINVSDPGEPLPLTPGHFLIGEPLIHVPDESYESSSVSHLNRWQFLQRMLQTFWKRWSQEYLSNLMNRYKWSSQVPEPKVGDIVLIKEDNLPPSRWLLGRILHKHPGNDDITRVVTVLTKGSTIKRPTSKICILPVVD